MLIILQLVQFAIFLVLLVILFALKLLNLLVFGWVLGLKILFCIIWCVFDVLFVIRLSRVFLIILILIFWVIFFWKIVIILLDFIVKRANRSIVFTIGLLFDIFYVVGELFFHYMLVFIEAIFLFRIYVIIAIVIIIILWYIFLTIFLILSIAILFILTTSIIVFWEIRMLQPPITVNIVLFFFLILVFVSFFHI